MKKSLQSHPPHDFFVNRALEKAGVGICSDVHYTAMIFALHYTEAAIS